jgi:hypothetical protein
MIKLSETQEQAKPKTGNTQKKKKKQLYKEPMKQKLSSSKK